MKNLKINEIFYSLQGEGLRMGEPTVFIRLSGCNLECDFCDTKYAWEEGRDMSADQVRERVNKIRRRHPCHWLCLTGGEPLIQDVRPLVRKLKRDGWKIQVETNATHYQNLPVDWFTVSPKPQEYIFQSEFRKKAKEVKLVICRELELKTIKKLRKMFPENIPLLLQAQSNTRWSLKRGVKLLEQASAANLKNIRLTVQLHKILGLP